MPGSSAEIELVRQVHIRAPEFVEAIGENRKMGYMGDRLMGSPVPIEDELALRYLRAVAAREPFSAFMGYYQVLEYRMNEAWFDDLQNRVSVTGASLARPADDMRRAGTEAAKLLGIRTQDVSYSELRALQVLAKGFDIDLFTRELGEYLDGALEYFANGHLPFAEVEHAAVKASAALK